MPRTRSAQAHEKVLKAAIETIAERGIEGASMDAIAQLSGVSKATVYKHWASKEALCLEAITTMQGDLPEFDTGNPRADITSLLRHLARARKSEIWNKIWPRLIGFAQSNPEFAQALRSRSTEPRRAQLARLLRQAASKGELRADIDVDFAMDLLVGPVMHRRFMGTETGPDTAEKIVDVFYKALRRGPE
jgi:AcrR family transcriptional regulator